MEYFNNAFIRFIDPRVFGCKACRKGGWNFSCNKVKNCNKGNTNSLIEKLSIISLKFIFDYYLAFISYFNALILWFIIFKQISNTMVDNFSRYFPEDNTFLAILSTMHEDNYNFNMIKRIQKLSVL